MENSAQLQERNTKTLTIADQDAIDRILEYLRLYPVSARDLDRTSKDLTGMAKEARARGESFIEAIGGDEGGFSKRLAQGLGKAAPLEQGLRLLQVFSLIGLFYWFYGLHSFPFAPLPDRILITWGQLTYVLLGTTYFCTAGRYMNLRRLYGGKWGKPFYYILNIVVFVLLIFPIHAATKSWITVFATLPAMPFGITLAVLGLGSLLLRRWLRGREGMNNNE